MSANIERALACLHRAKALIYGAGTDFYGIIGTGAAWADPETKRIVLQSAQTLVQHARRLLDDEVE